MQSPLEALRHEAASLYRLVDFIATHLQEQESTYTYLESTKNFFAHIRRLAKKTEDDLNKTVQNAKIKPNRIEKLYRPAVTIFTDKWTTLHTFIKPATDAHTLSIPGPLISLAEQSLQRIPGFDNCTIVVLLTPELMYFQNTVQGREKLPENTALVEVPYSQGPNFFTNLVVFHEIAHFVFARASGRAFGPGAVIKRLISKIEAVIEGQAGLARRELGGKLWARERMMAWTEEMFCDLFALRVVGPAFSFAMIDLLKLAGLMNDRTEIIFALDHPSPAFRMKEHRALLTADGWWKEVQELEAEHVALMSRLAAIATEKYRLEIGDAPKRSRLVTAFVKEVMPSVRSAVNSLTRGSAASVQDFVSTRAHVQKCLANGIVPSALVSRPSLTPTPFSIINAAYCSYLTSLPSLMSKLLGQDPRVIGHRKNWTQKIEAWTQKSLEDFELIKGARV